MIRTDLTNHKVVSLNEWLEPRKQFLIEGKEFTRLRDQLNRQRRELPCVKVEKNYVFDGPGFVRYAIGENRTRNHGTSL